MQMHVYAISITSKKVSYISLLSNIYSFAAGLDYLLYSDSNITFPRNSSIGDEQCTVFGVVLDDDMLESVETAYLSPSPAFHTDRPVFNGMFYSPIEVTIYSDECKHCSFN